MTAECTCGWPTNSDTEGHCFDCHEDVPERDLLHHLRLFHVDAYEDFIGGAA